MNQKALPELFEPKWVCAAALLFTPIYGGLLQAKNWEALGIPDEARASRHWIRTTLWLIALYLVLQVLFREEPLMNYAGPYFLIVLWGSWMLTSGARQLVHMKRLKPPYSRRPFGRTVTLGVVGWLLYLFVALAVALAVELTGFQGIPSETSGGSAPAVVIQKPEGSDKVIVREATEEEARAARELSEKAAIGRLRTAPGSSRP